MTTVEAFAPAKINLTLHVTGQREDGYHLLDSLVMLAGIGDRITVSPAQITSLTVTGPFARGVPGNRSNLVWRAAELLGVAAEIRLVKNLPPASGIGGGSSDAAATLRALSRLANRALPTDREILGLGADVPVCMRRALTHMRGIGEDLETLGPVPPLSLLVVNPGVEIATPRVFQNLATKNNPPMRLPMPDPLDEDAWVSWLSAQRNDLETPAITVAPVIGKVLEALRQSEGCRIARMSGSGASCFALMKSHEARDRAAQTLRRKNPDWWIAATEPCGADFS